MISKSNRRSILSTISFVASLTATSGVVAQESPSATVQQALALEEVVVTAQKRTEQLQDVPVAISAFSQGDVDKLQIRDIQTLSRSVPSLSFDTSGGEAHASIRGISTGYGLAPAVGLYIDEVPLDVRSDLYSGATTIELFDLDRIEVLRGPQGTLFGASSMGGTIRMITAPPDPTQVLGSAEAEGGYTDGGDTSYAIRGALNLPVNDHLAVRMVAVHRYEGGFIDRSVPIDYAAITGDEEIAERDVNDTSISSFRLALGWTSDSEWTVTPSFIYQTTDTRGQDASSPAADDYTQPGLFTNKGDYRVAIGSLKIEKDFGGFSLVSATSYLDKKTRSLVDISETGQFLVEAFGFPFQIPNVSLYVPVDYTQWTQELRLVSGDESSVRWVVGAYFGDTDQENVNIGVSEDFIPLIGTSDLVSYDGPTSDRQLAGFADVTYTPVEKLDLSAGVRVYNFHQTIEITQGGFFGGEDTPRTSAEETGVNPKFTVTYRPVDGVNLYATAAKGFRAGGANPRIVGGVDCTFEDLYEPSYDPDSIWNYELGAKTSLFDNRATVNFSAYQMDWYDFQGQINSSCGPFVGNIGSARTRGVDLEVRGNISDDLQAHFGFGYADAKIKKVDSALAAAGIGSPGQSLNNVPESQFSVGLDYEKQTGGVWTWFVAPNWQYVGSMPTSYEGTSPDRPSYDNVSLTAGFRHGDLEVSAFGDNLTNEVQVLSVSTGFYGVSTYYVGRPRTIGIRLAYQF